jgi:hypothetical protein
MQFSDYLTHQDQIYQSIADQQANALTSGMQRDPRLAHREGSLLFTFRYSPEAVLRLTELCQPLATLPVVCNAPNALHTTISAVVVLRDQPWEPSQYTEISDRLVILAKRILVDLPQVAIHFTKPTLSSSSVVLCGQPNEAFWQISQKVTKGLQAIRPGAPLPWGAHITLGRCTEYITAEACAQLADQYTKLEALGSIAPDRVEVGFIGNPTGTRALAEPLYAATLS